MAMRMDLTDGYIAVDWGTTNRRAYRVDASGAAGEEFADGGFSAAVSEIRERLGDHPLLMAGMIGSNRGWKEAPYVPCPAGIDDLAGALVEAGDRAAIVPGVSFIGEGRADVMRGEEVQLLGAVASGLVAADARVCHPGTHNKWATLSGGKIVEFRTVMTGELFNLLKDHSILADLLKDEAELDDAFREGVRHAIAEATLPADLFAVRAEVLLGQRRKEDAASYTSGLLIGSDVRIGLAASGDADITVIGRPELTRLYGAAIEQPGHHAVELDGERCFLAGIHEIAKRIA